MKIKLSIILSTALAIGFAGCGDDYKWDHNNVSKLEGTYTLDKIATYDNDANVSWYNAETRGLIVEEKVKKFINTQKLAAGISISVKYHDDGSALYNTKTPNGLNEETFESKYLNEYNYAFGCAELNTSHPKVMLGELSFPLEAGMCLQDLTPTHKFKVGSLTKTAVSRTILDMDDNNAEYPDFNINDDITKHLPSNIIALGGLGGITIYQLLHHTSGLGDINTSSDGSVVEKIKEALSKERVVQPGQMYKYNNTGYILLGQIIEKVAKDKNASATWQSEVKKRVDEAIGSNNSFVFPKTADNYPKNANGTYNYNAWLYDTTEANLTSRDNYSLAKGNGTSFLIDETPFSAADKAHSAGSAIANVMDVTKWMESIATNDNTVDANASKVGLLSPEYFEKHLNAINTSTYVDIYLGNTQWNLGAGIGYDKDQNSLFHLGNFSGYACHSVYSKNEKVTLTVCVNGNADLNKLPYEILEAIYPYRTKFLPTVTTTH